MIDIEANDRAAIEGIIGAMPKFTEPTTLDDLAQYHALLKHRLAPQFNGKPPPCECYRPNGKGPVLVRVGPCRFELEPLATS